MALIIEDGTGSDPNANSYSDVESLRTYAKLRGVDLSSLGDSDCETLLIKAMDYLESKRDKYKGYKTSSSQPLQWPRSEVWIDNALLGSNEMPRELEYAQLSLAIEAKDNDLQKNKLPTDTGPVIRKKVEGAVEVEYANPGTVQHVSAFAKPEALLAPLYKNNGLFAIRT
jgi:hypothetical protein